MGEVQKITIVPVARLAQKFPDGEGLSPDDLPCAIASNVALADIGQQMKSLDLELWSREYLSRHDVERIQGWKYALVHYYSEEEYLHGTPESQSRELLSKIFVALRVVRPSNVPFQYIHARIKDDGSFDPSGFSRAEMPLTVSARDKWATIRPKDIELLRALVPALLAAYETKTRPVTRAVNLLETGYNSPSFDVKLLLWVAGWEALFASSAYNGAPAVTGRLRHFLGSRTRIYDAADFPTLLMLPDLTLKDVLEDIYRVRNSLAHGEWVPDDIMRKPGHSGLASSYADILLDASGLALRLALARILRQSLLETFRDKGKLDTFFPYDPITKRRPCES
jgi:hypothetical protein